MERTFYTPQRELYIAWNTGKIVMGENGQATRVGERAIQFRNPAKSKFGSFTTSDADEIAYLENRSKTVGDVLDEEQYIKAATPVEQRADEATRKLEENNKLLADLRAREQEYLAQIEDLKAGSKASAKK